MNESEIRLIVLAKIAPWLLIILIVIIGIIKSCCDDTPLMDNSINKSIEYVEMLDVCDEEYNGFRVTYVTKYAVTKERLNEIQSRSHIQNAFRRLEVEGPRHFNSDMLNTNIYDFALFARKYDCDEDITIHCIFTCGPDKMEHYIGANPAIPNSARWMDSRTEQGNQWINHIDIYGYEPGGNSSLYRYWKCSAPYCISETDEHFSHFSEDERIR